MRKFFIIQIVVFLTGIQLFSQEIDATVNLDDQQINQEFRINITTLASDLERYIDNTNFTGIEWEGPKIPVDVSIAIGGGRNNIFTAQLLITSKRYLDGNESGSSNVVRVIDKEWTFEYARGAFHSYNPMRYNSFITLIDFYMLLIIGSDLDTYEELGGIDAYNKAKQICLLGQSNQGQGFQTYSQPGEFTRYNLVSELSDLRFEGFRILVFEFFVDGLDLIANDKEQALINLKDIILDMAKFKEEKMTGPSVLLQAFFNAKSYEISQTFKGTQDDELYKALVYLDPSHTMIYQEAFGF